MYIAAPAFFTIVQSLFLLISANPTPQADHGSPLGDVEPQYPTSELRHIETIHSSSGQLLYDIWEDTDLEIRNPGIYAVHLNDSIKLAERNPKDGEVEFELINTPDHIKPLLFDFQGYQRSLPTYGEFFTFLEEMRKNIEKQKYNHHIVVDIIRIKDGMVVEGRFKTLPQQVIALFSDRRCEYMVYPTYPTYLDYPEFPLDANDAVIMNLNIFLERVTNIAGPTLNEPLTIDERNQIIEGISPEVILRIDDEFLSNRTYKHEDLLEMRDSFLEVFNDVNRRPLTMTGSDLHTGKLVMTFEMSCALSPHPNRTWAQVEQISKVKMNLGDYPDG